MRLGAAELLILLTSVLIMAMGTVPALWASVDAARKPDALWEAAGLNKMMWIIVPLLAAPVCGIGGAVAAGIYATQIRPKLTVDS